MFSLLVVLAKPSVLVEKDCSVCVRVVMSSRLECCWNKVFDTTWQWCVQKSRILYPASIVRLT